MLSAKVRRLRRLSAAVVRISDALGYSAVTFLRSAARLPSIKFADESGSGDNVVSDYGVVTAGTFSRASSITETFKIVKDATDFTGKFFYEISQHKCFAREEAGLASLVAF